MVGITRKMCLCAAQKVFGNITDLHAVAQGMIESGVSRVDTTYGINLREVPDFVLEQMAESAGLYISDNHLRSNPLKLSVIEIRERIAEYLYKSFPTLVQYRHNR